MRHVSFKHSLRFVAAIGACVFATACSADSATSPSESDATKAADLFTQLADSVARANGDVDVGVAYASLAEAVRLSGRVSTISINVDGVATTFVATAQTTTVTFSTKDCPSGSPCTLSRPAILRTLIAWQQNDPRRFIQLSSVADADPIRAYLVPTFAPLPGPSASLVYYDGKGGTYFGTSGSQSVSVKNSSVICKPSASDKPTTVYPAFPGKSGCTESDFSIAFSGKAEPSTFLAKQNAGTGSHTLSMATQPVLGVSLELSADIPPLPPIKVITSASLPASLTAKVDSVVTLTLTVSNPSSTPVRVAFSSGQQYDFAILDATTGKDVWRWSAARSFAMMMQDVTVAANGTLVFTERWKPTAKGSFVALGSLTSVSHRAEAKAMVTLP